MKRTLAVLAVISSLYLAGCTDGEDATRVLEEEGYTQIEITGYRWFGCAKGDSFHTGFKAVTVAGKKTSGVVCSGWLKGSTIRKD